MAGGACYILFKDFRSPLAYHEKDVDVGTLNKGMPISFFDTLDFSVNNIV